jgi:DNA-binding transcriptional LysR family regulator
MRPASLAVLKFADQMEASSNRLETRVFGRDQSIRGLPRVTLAPTLATYLLMPDFADLARLHPEVEMEIPSSNEPVTLANREADVAIRVVYDRNALPLNLHSLRRGMPSSRCFATMRSTPRCGHGPISNRWFSFIFKPLLTVIVGREFKSTRAPINSNS